MDKLVEAGNNILFVCEKFCVSSKFVDLISQHGGGDCSGIDFAVRKYFSKEDVLTGKKTLDKIVEQYLRAIKGQRLKHNPCLVVRNMGGSGKRCAGGCRMVCIVGDNCCPFVLAFDGVPALRPGKGRQNACSSFRGPSVDMGACNGRKGIVNVVITGYVKVNMDIEGTVNIDVK